MFRDNYFKVKSNFRKSYCCSACDANDLPDFMNAEIVAGGGQPEYFDGEVVTYECVTNFGTTTDPFTCTCDTMTDPTAPDFMCTSMDLVNTCRRSKCVLYVAETPAIL